MNDGASLDPRFKEYLTIANNLEKILWGLLAFILGVSGFAFRFAQSMYDQPQSQWSWFNPFALFVIGWFFYLAAKAIKVLKKYRDKLGEYLERMEKEYVGSSAREDNWYFSWRCEPDQEGRSEASVHVMWFAKVMMIGSWAFAMYVVVWLIVQ